MYGIGTQMLVLDGKFSQCKKKLCNFPNFPEVTPTSN